MHQIDHRSRSADTGKGTQNVDEFVRACPEATGVHWQCQTEQPGFPQGRDGLLRETGLGIDVVGMVASNGEYGIEYRVQIHL